MLMFTLRSILISVFVCLSVRWHMSITTRSNFIKFSVHVTRGRGSVLIWQQCDMLYTPAFVDESCFHIREGIGQNQRRRVYLIQFARWWHQSDVRQRCLVEIARWRCSLLFNYRQQYSYLQAFCIMYYVMWLRWGMDRQYLVSTRKPSLEVAPSTLTQRP